MTAYLAGLTLGFSLILAIGAQNAFVLKQGLKRQHVFLVALICAVSDALLVAVGVSGFGLFVSEFPWVERMARYGGAAFLLLYALKSLLAALTKTHTLFPAEKGVDSMIRTVVVCLAFTWLNPHVYLDTVFLLGSVSTQFNTAKVPFALGAITSSFIFFFSLGYGARILTPYFQKPLSWKVLDMLVGIVMLSIAVSLLVG